MSTSTAGRGHTPGPWGVREEGHRLYVAPIRMLAGEVRTLTLPHLAEFREPKSGAARGCSPRWLGFDDETRANAHLIAAAPALKNEVALAAIELDEAANILARTHPRTADVLRKAAEKKRAALALAEGR